MIIPPGYGGIILIMGKENKTGTGSQFSVYHEDTPLTEEDCLYVIARNKDGFDFPLHRHNVYELNFIEGAAGAVRMVGDSVSEIGDYELVLIASPELTHGWENGNLKSKDNIREITIQFGADLFADSLLHKNQFRTLKRMFEKGRNGLSFSLAAILKVRPLLISLANETKGFYMMTTFMNMLYELSNDDGMTVLSSRAFAGVGSHSSSRRIKQVQDYIDKNYSKVITLEELAGVACMSGAAFSRFFKSKTGTNPSNYIIDVRIGKACRLLVDTTNSISEICFETGFNNISNFNRQFKKLKGRSPKEFRELYQKTQVLV